MATLSLLSILFAIGYSNSINSIKHNILQTSDGEEIRTRLDTYEPNICDPNVQQYSGYLHAGGPNGSNGNSYFYWFFESRNNPSTDPLIMWLQGGPGCSSQIALFEENGPCHIINSGNFMNDTILNAYSWNSNANIMFVDQPTMTGFSIGKMVHTLQQISKHMWAFLQHFMHIFPQYFTNGFFIAGESYSGHYIPNIVHYIYKQNKFNTKVIPLSGFAIGNGLTDPLLQFPFYAQMAYNSSTAINSKYNQLPLTKKVYQQMENLIANCSVLIKHCYDTRNNNDCYNATNCWKKIIFHGPVTDTGVNKYNLNIKCEKKHLCYDFEPLSNWLNHIDIQQMIGVIPSMKWKYCNSHVRHSMEPSGDTMSNSRQLLEKPLNNGIRGLIFAGDLDFVCNWLGNQAWTLQLQWNGHKSFNNAKMSEWSVNGKVAGQIRQGNNTDFTFVRIYNAGHMVPMDQPQVALELMNQFMSDTLRSNDNMLLGNINNSNNNNNNNNIQLTISVNASTLATLWAILFLLIVAFIWCYWMCTSLNRSRSSAIIQTDTVNIN